jgi:uncharacterized membrane protein
MLAPPLGRELCRFGRDAQWVDGTGGTRGSATGLSLVELTERPMNAYPPKSSADPASTPSLDAIVERNIQAVLDKRREEAAAVTKHQGAAMAIGRFIGSFGFIYAHLVLFGGWILANTVGLPGIPRFDPELVLVATFAAIEAIFLTTLVLINQNRMAAVTERRAELDLQISLLTEHEVTRMLHLVSAVADRLKVHSKVDGEIEELKRDVGAAEVLEKIEHADGEGEASKEDPPPRS